MPAPEYLNKPCAYRQVYGKFLNKHYNETRTLPRIVEIWQPISKYAHCILCISKYLYQRQTSGKSYFLGYKESNKDKSSLLEVSGKVILTGTAAHKVVSQEFNRCICRVCELHVFSLCWKSIMQPWKLKDKYWHQAGWKNLPSVVVLTWKQTWDKHCTIVCRLRLQWWLH